MPKGFKELAAQLEDLKDDINDAANDAVANELNEAKKTAQSRIDKVRGNLWSSLRTARFSLDRTTTRHKLVSVGKVAPHNKYVELGTGAQFNPAGIEDAPRPYKPPTFSPELVEAIDDWVHEKPVIPHTPRYTQDDLGWAIAHVISEIGTSPHPFMRPAAHAHVPQIPSSVKTAVRKEIRKF